MKKLLLFALAFLLAFNAGQVFSASLSIGGMQAWPGRETSVPVNLDNAESVGGFEILISADHSALTFLGCTFTDRDDFGQEYNHIDVDSDGPGTVRVTYRAHIDNGPPHDPIAPGSGPIFYLNFTLSSSIGYGNMAPIIFIINGSHDNELLDENAHQFAPVSLTQGWVLATDFEAPYGDPNLDGIPYGISDLMLVARRLVIGYSVWIINPPVQEAAADLNGNGFVDVVDMIRFMNYLDLWM